MSDKNAVLFELDNYNDFAQKLAEVIENIDAYVDKRISSRQAILDNEFTWQANANKVVNIATGLTKLSSR